MSRERNLGANALQRGDYDTARAYLELAVAQSPEDFQALIFLGGLYHQLKCDPEAVEILTRAVGLHPDNPQAQYNLAVSLDRVGRRQEAIATVQRAIALQPDYALARRVLHEWERADASVKAIFAREPLVGRGSRTAEIDAPPQDTPWMSEAAIPQPKPLSSLRAANGWIEPANAPASLDYRLPPRPIPTPVAAYAPEAQRPASAPEAATPAMVRPTAVETVNPLPVQLWDANAAPVKPLPMTLAVPSLSAGTAATLLPGDVLPDGTPILRRRVPKRRDENLPVFRDAPRVCAEANEALRYGLLSLLPVGIVYGPLAIGRATYARSLMRYTPDLLGNPQALAAIVLGIVGTLLSVVEVVLLLTRLF